MTARVVAAVFDKANRDSAAISYLVVLALQENNLSDIGHFSLDWSLTDGHNLQLAFIIPLKC